MIELLREYLPAILVAWVIGLIVGFLIFRPRQRVRLTDSAPLRPHMASSRRSETKYRTSEAAVAAVSELTGVPGHRHPPSRPEDSDDFLRIKGVGPKLADMLHARGFVRFEQLAHLTPEEIDIIDQQLGPFAGRIRRDRIVEQAGYLARGDVDGFEQQFGKL